MAITRIEPYIINSNANFTFAGVNATSNLNVTGVSNLGPNGNVIITGGSNGQVLTTDGTGVLSWTTVSGGGGSANSISNGNSNVNIPAANGNVTVSVAGNSNIAVFTGTGVNIAGTLNATGNVTGNFFIGNGSQLTGIPGGTSISNGNSNINIPVADGNINLSAVGNSNVVVVTGTGVNIAGTLNATGNANVGNIGANIGVFTGNISAANASLGNLVSANYLQGVLTTASQPNITSVGTLGSLTVSGNGNIGGNLTANNFIAGTGTGGNLSGANIISANTGNFSAALNVTGVSNLGPVSNVIITGGSTGQVLTTNGAGNLSWTTVGTGSGISNGNSSISIPVANSNVNFIVAGNSNVVVVTGTGINVAGTSNTTGNIVGGGELNIAGNAVIGGNLTVDGNLIYVNVTDLSVEDPIIQLQTGPNGAAPSSNSGKDVGVALNYYDTAAKIAFMGWDVSNAEISFGSNVGISSEVVTFTQLANIRAGNAQLGNLVTANFVTGTLTTAAQPNITSVGTLSSLNVSGVSNLGPVGNVRITGGTANYVLKTDGNGNLSWTAQTGGSGTVTVQESDNVGANVTNTISNVSTFNFDKTTGIFVTNLGNGNALISLASSFKTWEVNGQPSLVAVGEDTVEFIAGNGIQITTSNVSNPKSITFTATGGGGGGSGNVIVDTFTGNGSQTVFTLTTTPTSEDYILVNIDGVLQLHDAYTLAGNSLTLSSAPVNSAAIEVQTWNMGSGGGSGSNAAFTVSNFTGDGSTANFAISNGATVNNTLVTLNGVLQAPTTDYTISGNILTFGTAPSNGQAIMFRELSGSGGGGSGGASNARVTGYSLVFGG